VDRTERFYRIQRLLNQQKYVTRQSFLRDLGVSIATFKRDIAYMRDRLLVPIEWDRDQGGYFLDASEADAQTYQLPGLWFSAEEIHALLTVEHLLERIQPGLLGPQVRPLRERIRKILESGDYAVDEVTRRIRILQMGARPVEPAHFQSVASGLLSRHRLLIQHYRRASDETLDREISPQRLVYYRDNWYLDAWCHLRKALRTFAMDAVLSAEVLERRARDIRDDALDAELGAGFGIFSGARTQTAVLRFEPVRSRWVSREIWHPQQEGHLTTEGAWLLRVPYSDPRELMMDILKYGADVEVLAPAALRRLVQRQLSSAARQYARPAERSA
jgi:predicted DNA-binding transcriptional regulator YafY